MKLILENIGMISKAEIELNGLTIIAGENDTGKSTVGKILYSFSKGMEVFFKKNKSEATIKNIFGNSQIMGENYSFFISNNEVYFGEKNGEMIKCAEEEFINNFSAYKSGCFIDTPDILTKVKYIKNANFLMYQNNLKFFIPHQVSDLILRLSQDIITNKDNELYKKITSIINGEVYYDRDRDDFYFKKNNLDKEVNIHNTSNGIKMFGLLQILIANETIKENSILIFDEPEVHLHPKWQLKYAEIIIELVKSGVTVLVTSHSPYIVEALKTYSDKAKLEDKTNFYLAESKDGVSSTIKNVSNDLEPIFEKLSEPFNKLEQEEIENFQW